MDTIEVNDKCGIVAFIRELGAFCKTQDGYMFLLNLLCAHRYMFGDEIFNNVGSDETDTLIMEGGRAIHAALFRGIGIYDEELFEEAIANKDISDAHVMEAFFLTRKLVIMSRMTEHEFNTSFLIDNCFRELKNLAYISGLDPVA